MLKKQPKQKKDWEKEFIREYRRKQVKLKEEPEMLEVWILDFISQELAKVREEAHERGYEMGSKMNIPTKKALERNRQKLIEKLKEWVKKEKERSRAFTLKDRMVRDDLLADLQDYLERLEKEK